MSDLYIIITSLYQRICRGIGFPWGSAKSKTLSVSSTIVQQKFAQATWTWIIWQKQEPYRKQLYILSTQQWSYKRCSYVCVCVCVCQTRMFSVKLNVCICVGISELKGEDRLVLTYMCMYMHMSWYVWAFWPTLLTVVYICGSSMVLMSLSADLLVSPLLNKKLCYLYFWVK